MSTNIIEAVQKQMGYKPLHKVSPNTQEIEHPEDPNMATPFEQAVVISVVAGLYQTVKQQQHNPWGINSTNTLAEIFGEDKDNIVMHVANYAHVGTQKAEGEMHRAGTVALEIINNESGHDEEKAKAYLTDQRTNILTCIPADLNLGKLLHDKTIDDRTNKMEGPVSGLMHTIEKIFSDTK
jgi:hypothetical protein